jgi:hypothetical protein
MKTNTASLSLLGTLVLSTLLVVGILKIQHVYAQVDATSSDAVAASSTDAAPVADASTSTTPDTAENTEATAPADATDTAPAADATTVGDAPAGTTPTVSDDAATTSASVAPTEPPPQGLAEVHIIGTKYTDYFTDGTTITSYPGDPAIDSHFSEPNAPIPTHEGLTWLHTAGEYLYDTPSGDLEVGDYAVQANGKYISNAPAIVSATSTPEVLGASTSESAAPSDTSTTSATSAPDTSSDTSSTSTVTVPPIDTPAPSEDATSSTSEQDGSAAPPTDTTATTTP